ncbi:MAG: biotin--[acetyl-CoA-carboxylase] ligase [Firmicutes bacterium]|nr:biotin--[acetyl-CoA-carboxylase] ligase [Bacillota bacterium]
MKHEVFLSLGSNIGNRAKNLAGALVFLAELPETSVEATSSYYETRPMGVTGQRDYLNQVVKVKTGLSPADFKNQTRRIEDYYGRDRRIRWGPRAVDIDILLYDDESIKTEDLTIPHPRMWERAFVLIPLAELAPELATPSGVRVRELAAKFDPAAEGVRIYTPAEGEADLDRLYPSVVLAGLDPEELGHPLIYKLEVGSTNDELRELALEGAPEGTTVVAETQWKGKGRSGRSWVSRPFAGIWCSVLLRPGIKPYFVPSLNILGALALAKAVNGFAPRGADKAKIKWPNDLLIGGAKVAGCLAESGIQGEKLSYVVLGTGINVHQQQDELPDLDKEISSLYLAWDKRVSRQALFRSYLLELTALYQDYLKHGLARMVSEYEELSCTLGRRVRVLGAESFSGVAVEITPSGSLMIQRDDGRIKEVFAEEVSIVESKE